MTAPVGEELPKFPFPGGPFGSPPPEYAVRRSQCPFGQVELPSGHPAVLLVTYRDVAEALTNPNLSHNLTAPGSPRLFSGPSPLDDPDFMLNMEGAEHLRLRRIVASTFTPKRVGTWKPAIQALADGLADEVAAAGPPADIVGIYSFPLPIQVICELIGIPQQDTAAFRDWSTAFVASADMPLTDRVQRVGRFFEYTRKLVRQRREHPETGLVDDLIAARDGADRLSEHELEYMIMVLLAAGNETTSNILGRSLLTLLRDGGRLWKQLLDAPHLVPAAVNELLRYNPLGNNGGTLRIATDRVALPSGTIEKGQAVFVSGSSAMRDEAVYDEPEEVRFDREGPQLLAFGAGPHFCLGAHLARAQLEIGIATLLRRFPTLSLAIDEHEVRFSAGEVSQTVAALPVSW